MCESILHISFIPVSSSKLCLVCSFSTDLLQMKGMFCCTFGQWKSISSYKA